MSAAGKPEAGAIPSTRAALRRSASKALKRGKPRRPQKAAHGGAAGNSRRRIGSINSGGGDVAQGDLIHLQPKTAELLRVLAAAYTKF